MSNVLYPKAKEAFLGGDIDLVNDTIKATLIDLATYTYSAAHQYMNTNTVAGAAKIATITVSGKSITDGVFDCTDWTWPSVSGNESEAVMVWKDGGDGGTTAAGTISPLIAFIDTATGLPVTPNGGDINVTVDSGGNKVFAL